MLPKCRSALGRIHRPLDRRRRIDSHLQQDKSRPIRRSQHARRILKLLGRTNGPRHRYRRTASNGFKINPTLGVTSPGNRSRRNARCRHTGMARLAGFIIPTVAKLPTFISNSPSPVTTSTRPVRAREGKTKPHRCRTTHCAGHREDVVPVTGQMRNITRGAGQTADNEKLRGVTDNRRNRLLAIQRYNHPP